MELLYANCKQLRRVSDAELKSALQRHSRGGAAAAVGEFTVTHSGASSCCGSGSWDSQRCALCDVRFDTATAEGARSSWNAGFTVATEAELQEERAKRKDQRRDRRRGIAAPVSAPSSGGGVSPCAVLAPPCCATDAFPCIVSVLAWFARA
jgi:hypothetical protein